MKSSLCFGLLLLSLAFAPSSALFGQTYKNALGIRVDKGLSATYQQFIGNGLTIEGMAHLPLFNRKETGLTLVLEKHQKVLFRGLNLYAGGGAHYYWTQKSDIDPLAETPNIFGLTGIGGAEVSFGKINVSVDWKPELHLSGDQVRPFEWGGTAVSVRVILEKRERNRIFKKKKKPTRSFWVEIFE